MTLGPYRTGPYPRINYAGNRIFSPHQDVSTWAFEVREAESRVRSLRTDHMWGHVARINHRIMTATTAYFDTLGALFTTLPLTTRMISSPGAVYGHEAISYTSDTCPITLNWFDLPQTAFLSESSQIYLELALLQHGVDHVYSVYNSFRKEETDATHLSEFHHIEYEGTVDQATNEEVALGLVRCITSELLEHEEQALAWFLSPESIRQLDNIAREECVTRLTFAEALQLLYRDTGDSRYQRFTMDRSFGAWEEVRLTELVGGMVVVSQFPLLEVPFYHAVVDDSKPAVANNADFIWPGYREFMGSGHRVRSSAELAEKARVFQLPAEDYRPYLQSRELGGYRPTSGFGLGWERLLQGLLEMPAIWSAVQFPRSHATLKP